MGLGRPPNVIARAKQLARTLRDFPSHRVIPKPVWDSIVMERYEVAPKQVQEITKTGETLGYWKRRRGKSGGPAGGSQAWTVEILGQHPGTPQSPQEPVAGVGVAATTNPSTIPVASE